MKNKSYDKKIFRLLHILQRLNGGGFYKTSDLAQEFNVTRRTVQRDLVLLESAGFLLDDANDGYKFAEGFSLQKITVTPFEKFLLNSFFNLFSKAGAPLDGVARTFLGKLLTVPKETSSSGQLDSRRKAIIQREVNGLAKSIEAKLEDLRFPAPFKKQADLFIDFVEGKIKALEETQKVGIKCSRTGSYSQREAVAIIAVPKTYFKDRYRHLDFSRAEKNRLFKIHFLLPNKFFKDFRAVLKVEMNFKFWGPHLKAKTITCFDDFAARIGFSKAGKECHYEASYGSKNEDEETLITRVGISWQQVIPMSEKIIQPFLTKTGGIWIVSDLQKGTKVIREKA